MKSHGLTEQENGLILLNSNFPQALVIFDRSLLVNQLLLSGLDIASLSWDDFLELLHWSILWNVMGCDLSIIQAYNKISH